MAATVVRPINGTSGDHIEFMQEVKEKSKKIRVSSVSWKMICMEQISNAAAGNKSGGVRNTT